MKNEFAYEIEDNIPLTPVKKKATTGSFKKGHLPWSKENMKGCSPINKGISKYKSEEEKRKARSEQYKKHYNKNSFEIYKRNREYKLSQIEKWREYDLKWKKDHVSELKEKYGVAVKLRARLYKAIKRQNGKHYSAVENLGCSIEDFKIYLESLFINGMNWDNQGKWHLDHIIPLSKFDLTDIEQIKIACHYTNIQPLWAKDNLSKKDRII